MSACRPHLTLLLLALALLPACGSTEDQAGCEGVLCSAGRCVVQGGQPTCECTAFEKAAGVECTLLGLDDENDLPEHATPLQSAPSAGTGSIDAKKFQDRDVYAFPVTRAHLYAFTCTPQSLTGCSVELLGSIGGARISGSALPGGGAVAVLRAPADGTAYATVSAREAGATGAYRYTLEDVGVDDHADVAAEAQPVPSSTLLSGVLETRADRDLFVLELPERSYQAFTCSVTGGAAWLRFVSPATGDPVGYLQDISGPYSTTFFAAKGTQHHFSVEGASAAGVSYRCETLNLGPDDHGSTLATATPLAAGVLRGEGVLHSKGESDCFTFQLSAGHSYRKRCVSEAVPLCQAGVLSQNVETSYALVHAASSGPGVACASSWVASLDDRAYGPFALVLDDLGPDLHAATFAEATLVAPDAAPAAGVLMPRTDVDVFRFEASAQRVYRASSGGAMQVLTAAGEALRQSAIELLPAGQIGFEAPADGPLFLRVEGNPREYQLTLEALGLDDHADAAGGATALTVGAAASGVMELTHDEDWFAIDLEQRAYAVSAVAQHALEIFASDGVTRVYAWQGEWSTPAAGRYYIRVVYAPHFAPPFRGDLRYSFTVSPR